MRDILFLGVIACLVLLAFRKPYVAVTLWLWTGLFVPKHWLYGFASGISYNTLFVLITVIVYGIATYKRPMRLTPLILMMLLFTVHITITTTVTVSDPDYVWSEWIKFSKTLLIILFVSLIIQTRNHFNYLLMAYVFSLG